MGYEPIWEPSDDYEPSDDEYFAERERPGRCTCLKGRAGDSGPCDWCMSDD